MEHNQLKEAFAEHGIRRIKVGGYDIDGILRGKYVALDKFWGALREPIGFCDVIFGWDAADALYDNARLTGWHTGYPDTKARIDTSTFRVLPWEAGTATFLMDFVREDGSPHPACTRGLFACRFPGQAIRSWGSQGRGTRGRRAGPHANGENSCVTVV